jgi:hypothetical protein
MKLPFFPEFHIYRIEVLPLVTEQKTHTICATEKDKHVLFTKTGGDGV